LILSSFPAAGVKTFRGASILVVGITESLTIASELGGEGRGLKLYFDRGMGWIR
jgi:hypothetical protein